MVLMPTVILLVFVAILLTAILLAPDLLLQNTRLSRRLRLYWTAIGVKVGVVVLCCVEGAAWLWLVLFVGVLLLEIGFRMARQGDLDGVLQ